MNTVKKKRKALSKYTPGPWKIYDHTDLGPYEGGYWIGVEDPECGPVTFATSQLGCEEAAKYANLKANAHLIAAAPDMLEALRSAYAYLTQYQCDHDKPGNCDLSVNHHEPECAIANTFEHIIAKVEGA